MANDNTRGEADDGTTGQEGGTARKGKSKKLLLIAGGGALLVLLGAGAGAYFLFFSGSGQAPKPKVVDNVILPLVPPQVVFYDLPDIVVNIQAADSAPAYLKLSLSLELASADEKDGIHALMPRIVDQFQGYLRELRIDDLHGSAGVIRIKEELLRRASVAAAPYPIRDVLLKEMIIQ